MDKGEIVYQLNGGCCWKGRTPVTPHRLAGKEAKSRTNPLATLVFLGGTLLIYPSQMITEHGIEGQGPFTYNRLELSLNFSLISIEGTW
jgi:hypothetical protein